MYDARKVLIVGGGDPPQQCAEFIDLNSGAPSWTSTGNMSSKRRHANATLLPDGTVLVTGGTSGGEFNDLANPVKHAEVWDPATGAWTSMAAEAKPRLYDSTAAAP